MSRTGPAHYHQSSNNICYRACPETYYDTSAPCIYPSAPSRPCPVAGHQSHYGPAIPREPKPNPTTRLTKSRSMKFDEVSHRWYFTTPEAPGVKWLKSVWDVKDLPQSNDSEFLSMVNEYHMNGHVIEMPDQNSLPYIPREARKSWWFKRAPPPPPVQKQAMPYPPAPAQPQNLIGPIYYWCYPAAPQYAGGSAHPVSMHLPSGVPPCVCTPAPLPQFSGALQEVRHPGGSERLGPPPGTPGPRHCADASAHRGYHSLPEDFADEGRKEEDDEYEVLDCSYGQEVPPSPGSQWLAQKLEGEGFGEVDPHTNAGGSL
ncbi:hypothetical protein FRC11_008147 [Ceratobasidium sp. 423]|nr:hypothetical protein FRC11_008147 [Ceratobasidium sp. 423]